MSVNTSMSLDELKKIIKEKKKEVKKDYKELREKEKLIKQYKKLTKVGEKIRKGKNIIKKPKHKKIKSFQEYFEECIRNKKIPNDTPPYLRKALERAILEYEKKNKQPLLKYEKNTKQPLLLEYEKDPEKELEKDIVIKEEKSALWDFANKYIIKGIPNNTPDEYFIEIKNKLKDFFTFNRNIKFNMILVCIMEQENFKQETIIEKEEGKAYFVTGNLINMNSTDVDKLIERCIDSINAHIENYFNTGGSAWHFKEVDRLEIHTVEYNPTKGSSYIPLPDWITNKKAIVNIQNKDEKCFLWCVLRYLHPREKDEHRLTGLKEYEHSLNTKGIPFPMKLKDITKFEKLNPELPGINDVSVNENKNFYPLRMAQKDCINTIDLFLYEEDGISHYSLIKNFNRLIKSQKTSSKNGKIFICKKCFTHYAKEELLKKHISYCLNNETVSVKMPLSRDNVKI